MVSSCLRLWRALKRVTTSFNLAAVKVAHAQPYIPVISLAVPGWCT